ncbi:hypothetical protein DE146DRAFT_36095 [Phaeosphaeria sp. MPI-PUGE-AT-0046c]|nr:hypothetical protein DE146DRAFT_36095 [Phaeosphaeria sp. MPI-PUGE-AT-0046c]
MQFSTTTALSAILAMAPLTQAHMYMLKPVPYGGNTDKSPLAPDGSNFPCKNVPYTGTINQWPVGSTQTLELFGSAVHDGGSCQISVTTDKAPTKDSKFKVIHSFEGDCPFPPSAGGNKPDGDNTNPPLPFTVPPELPNGEATMVWTWFNRVGNREMYANCAGISVSGGASNTTAFDALPDMAVANIAGHGTCTTVPGVDYTFENPGKYVTRSSKARGPFAPLCGGAPAPGGSGSGGNTGAPPAAPAPANPGIPPPANPVAPSQAPPVTSAPAVSPPAASPPAGPVTSTTRAIITVTAPSGPAPSSKKDAQTPPAAATSQAPAAPSTGSGASCSQDGIVVCSSDGKQFGLCNHGKAVFQDVAAGTICKDGKIDRPADFATTLRTIYA